jgi:hypothetical protein
MKMRTKRRGPRVPGSKRLQGPEAPGRSAGQQVAFAWYSEEEWNRLRQMATDVDDLDPSYQDWLRQADDALAEMVSNGVIVRKVALDVRAASEWCAREGRAFDSAGRAAFVAAIAGRISRE